MFLQDTTPAGKRFRFFPALSPAMPPSWAFKSHLGPMWRGVSNVIGRPASPRDAGRLAPVQLVVVAAGVEGVGILVETIPVSSGQHGEMAFGMLKFLHILIIR